MNDKRCPYCGSKVSNEWFGDNGACFVGPWWCQQCGAEEVCDDISNMMLKIEIEKGWYAPTNNKFWQTALTACENNIEKYGLPF